jgi:hypothetical protein
VIGEKNKEEGRRIEEKTKRKEEGGGGGCCEIERRNISPLIHSHTRGYG